MTYIVVWKPEAEAELAHLWESSLQRAALTAAADQIDSLLTRRPLQEGESREGATRVLFLPPLGVYYHVNDNDRRVSVLRVWRFE